MAWKLTFAFLCLLLSNSSLAFDSPKPVDSVVKIPVDGLVSPVVAGLQSDPTGSLLAVHIRSQNQNQMVLFDKALKPYRTINVPRGIQAFAVSTDALFYSSTTSDASGQTPLCSIAFAGDTQKCMRLPSFSEQLVVVGAKLYEVSDGAIYEIDINTSKRRLISYHHQLTDLTSSANSDGVHLVVGQPGTGAGVVCYGANLTCGAVEFLSPAQIGARSTKHTGESLMRQLTVSGGVILTIGAGYRSSDGFLVNQFSPSGAFLGELRLAVPSIAELEPTPRNLAMKPVMASAIAAIAASMNSLFIVHDTRTLSLVVYKLGN
jgi:hypothetical protein